MMRNLITTAFLSCALMLSAAAHAGSRLPGIKIAVTNPSGEERRAEPVVIPIAELSKVAPDLRAGSLIVTVTRTTDLQQDAVAIQATEIPSQVDDLDDDGKADELAFQLDLKPRETCIVTVSYGEPGRIFKIRADYPAQTDALFAKKIEGLGWESDKNAWRIYFDPRNAIDLYGKRRSMLMLQRFATPEYDYHAESADGRDIYKVGNALGIVMITPSTAAPVDDPANHLLTFSAQANSASWYTLAAWDQEGSNDHLTVANNQEMQERASLVTPHPGIQTKDQFVQAMQRIADAAGNPVQVKILSSAPAAQSAPPDTLRPTASRTYSQAIALLKQEIDRTAAKWEPAIMASTPAGIGTSKGPGFFVDGDNQTGEWKKREGFFWTG